nr:MAG TPA: hypothetical protein [Caudoviricetes sp.]DAP84027.1 MAG TPA: hypothetical protein [Caudoviricetes sp.]
MQTAQQRGIDINQVLDQARELQQNFNDINPLRG